jgi:hypothetical protein
MICTLNNLSGKKNKILQRKPGGKYMAAAAHAQGCYPPGYSLSDRCHGDGADEGSHQQLNGENAIDFSQEPEPDHFVALQTSSSLSAWTDLL